MDRKVLQSEKLNIINQTTFESIQDNDVNHQQRQLKNSKYKKTQHSQNFNLMSYLVVAHSSQRQKKRHKPSSKIKRIPLKKRGKVRENGRKKKLTRLKKAICRQRQLRLIKRLENDYKAETKISENRSLNTADEKQINEIVEMTKTFERINIVIPQPQDKPRPQPVEMKVNDLEVPYIKHSRSFRNYCDNYPSKILCNLTDNLLRMLNTFQSRAFSHNELKAQAHRRLVIGFHEVQSHLNIKKVKLVIMATDMENSHGQDGLNEKIASIKMQCKNENIPYVFSLTRRALSYSLWKKASISCVGILDYDGARDIFQQLINSLYEARALYNKLTEQIA